MMPPWEQFGVLRRNWPLVLVLHSFFRADYDEGRLYARDGRPVKTWTEAGYWFTRTPVGNMRVHLALWFMAYGQYPRYEIDHIDRDKSNNSLRNLRDVPARENWRNIPDSWECEIDGGPKWPLRNNGPREPLAIPDDVIDVIGNLGEHAIRDAKRVRARRTVEWRRYYRTRRLEAATRADIKAHRLQQGDSLIGAEADRLKRRFDQEKRRFRLARREASKTNKNRRG